MEEMDDLTDHIADEIERLVLEAASGMLPCDLGDACVELACAAPDMVTMRLTAHTN